jgi:hypothetical protein
VNAIKAELSLADAVSQYYADPLAFVMFAFPRGEPGELDAYSGPDGWQRVTGSTEFLISNLPVNLLVGGEPPAGGAVSPIGLGSYRWRRHCRGLYQTPMAA